MTRDSLWRLLFRPLRLWIRYWPQLAACYLLGLLVRRGAIELAAWVGHDNNWWAALIMPIAGMARLGSYVAMFLVLRPALPALSPGVRRTVDRIDIFTTVIVPFFAIYLAWKLFREDWLAFETRALNYRIDHAVLSGSDSAGLDPGSLPVGTTTWVLIGAALLCRWGLSKVKDRLPRWMVAVRIYVDALWVFLVLSFSANQGLMLLTNPGQWISRRRIMVWFSEIRGDLFAHFGFLETLWDGAMWLLRTTFGGVAVPLMWLAVAGIVYCAGLAGDWRGALQRVGGTQAGVWLDRSAPVQERVRARWLTLPKYLRDKSSEHATGKLGKFKPITDTARVIAHLGIPALALYVFYYLVLAWLDMTGAFYGVVLGDGYLFRGMAWLLGPHPWEFWNAYGGVLALVSHLLVEPLRICLIAATFAYAVEHIQQRAPTAPVAP